MRNRQQFALIAGVLVTSVIVIVFLIRSLMGRQAKIEDAQKQIVSLLDQLDPIARMQVAQHVVETELSKF